MACIVLYTLPLHRVDSLSLYTQDEISVFVPPPQLAEHVEFADQSDQIGHGKVLQITSLV